MELRHYINLARRWWWVILLPAVVGGVLGYLLTPTPPVQYRSSTTLLISQGDSSLPDVQDISTGQRLSTTYGALMLTDPVLNEVIQQENLDTSPEALANRVSITTQENTNLLTLSVTYNDPEMAAAVANRIVEVFIAQNENLQTGRYDESRQQLEAEITALQEQLRELRSESNALFNEEEALQEQIAELQDDTTANQSRLQDIEDQIEAIDLELQVYDRYREEGQWRLLDPGAEIRYEIQRESLVEEQGVLVIQIEDDQEQINQLKADLDALQIELAPYSEQLNELQPRYQALLTELSTLRLAETEAADFLSVVEEAETGSPINSQPRQTVNALQGVLAGAVIGMGGTLLIDYIRQGGLSKRDVEEITQASVLGMIGKFEKDGRANSLVVMHDPRSVNAESFRMLRSNIEFLAPEKNLRSITITSSVPVEGKTTTAANLAVALAASGKRVILVDADLRRPRLHLLFNRPNGVGMTTAFTSENGNLSEHVVYTEQPNLVLMTSGPLPASPSDLLSAINIPYVLDTLAAKADYVLIDTPPLLAASDTVMLARASDATLLVVREGATDRAALERGTEILRQANVNLAGVIMNGVSQEKNGYYYQYYYRSEA